MKRIKLITLGSLALACAGAISACSAAEPAPQEAAFADRQLKALSDRGPKQGWTVLPSGLRYRIYYRAQPAGPHPKASDTVLVRYLGKLDDGTVFDKVDAKDAPIALPLDQVIAGWTQGIPLLGVGDRGEFAIPAQLGYGTRAMGPIPSGATLLFNIELVGIAPSAADAGAAPAAARDPAFAAAQQKALDERGAAQGWTVLPSGLRYRIVDRAKSPGAHPTVADIVTVHYAGQTAEGVEFDSSFARGQPATMPLAQLIPGWQEGIPLMAVGDTAEFALPADLAYGDDGSGPIRPGATLLFKIQLIDIPKR